MYIKQLASVRRHVASMLSCVLLACTFICSAVKTLKFSYFTEECAKIAQKISILRDAEVFVEPPDLHIVDKPVSDSHSCYFWLILFCKQVSGLKHFRASYVQQRKCVTSELL